MSFSILGGLTGKGRNSLLIDVESGAVTVALYSEEKLAHRESDAVLYVKRIFVPRTKTFSSAHAKKEFEEVFVECRKATEKFGRISNIHVSVGAPWVYTRSFNLTREWETPVEFTKSIEDSMFKEKESKNVYFEYFRAFLGNTVLPVRVKISDKKQIFVNGYPFPSYEEKKGTQLSVVGEEYIFIEWMLGLLEKNAEYFGNPTPHFFSYNTAIPFLKDESEYLFVVIGAYATEVGYVDRLSQSIKILSGFPVGERTLVEALESSGKMTSVEAESILNMYNDERLHPNFSEAKKKVLTETASLWVKKFEEVLHAVSVEAKIPRKVFLVPFERARFAKRLLSEENYAQPSLPEKSWNVILASEFCADKTFLSPLPHPRLELLLLYLAHVFQGKTT